MMTIWKLAPDARLTNADAVAEGMRYHLTDAPLWTILAQAGPQQQQRAYVALHGCAGCALGHCELGCRAGLIRRTLRAGLSDPDGGTLLHHGLVTTGFQHFLWLWPARADAPLLDGALLHGWPRTLLTLRWAPGIPRPTVGGIVAFGGNAGPDIRPRLHALDWDSREVPTILHRWVSNPLATMVATLRTGRHAAAPTILLPLVETGASGVEGRSAA
ncbi:MAG: hypothetical protein EI684_22230 [Candidatus Viridilinea halotolerans]|uniref:Uncharacterized protein n=1 Tax=Candidatus Viridilinea halotolerans TaxID=2491704 RepID=A0A426TQX3_9CHLR|nr:MAG: hypothetical protein EI684_22230 [Candidatus Viridilinea halotolerans]